MNINEIIFAKSVDFSLRKTKVEGYGLSMSQKEPLEQMGKKLKVSDFVFYRVNKITFEDKAPSKDAIENVLSTVKSKGVNFLYLIRGTKQCVEFYYGLSNDLAGDNPVDSIDQLGDRVLKSSIEGNFRGCVLEKVESPEFIQNELLDSQYKIRQIEGLPGEIENKENTLSVQGIDRLVDVMAGDEYMLLVTAKDIKDKGIERLENTISSFYDLLSPLTKTSVQKGRNDSLTTGMSISLGTNDSKAQAQQSQRSDNYGVQRSESSSQSHGYDGDSDSTSKQFTYQDGTYSKSQSESFTLTHGSSKTQTNQNSKTNGTQESFTIEQTNKAATDLQKYIDEVLLKRIDYGKGKGLFLTSISIYAKEQIVLDKLENSFVTIFSGKKGNRIPLRGCDASRSLLFRNFQVPLVVASDIQDSERFLRMVLGSQYVSPQSKSLFLGNWLSAGELSLIVGMPQKEVNGLSVTKEVEYGLNYKPNAGLNKIAIGKMVQCGVVRDSIDVYLDKEDLNRHVFVCGVTGSGKTTTCMNLLLDSEYPYMVIEPAKTEYRILTNDAKKRVYVYTLGQDDLCPFRMNPLEFAKGESITSHVSIVKACIEASSEMEAAIPQIIESALYRVYEKKGWDINNNQNEIYDDPYADGVYSFPTLSDLIAECKVVVDEQKFGDRLGGEYYGSIRARLQGLIQGAKGQMLNTPRSINFRELIKMNVILELDSIKSGEEKALIMGFILSNVGEAIKAEFYENHKFKHITLVEEAHRLLSDFQPGDSKNKKNGVEVFSNMLAEVRKYGEGLIIADQIPNKMAPDVLKNTNTKIVHKLFAQDDKDAIGNTMALSKEQKEFLSNLTTGRSIIFAPEFEKALQVQITQKRDTKNEFADEKLMKNRVLDYYVSNYKNGVFPELLCFKCQPTSKDLELVIRNKSKFQRLVKAIKLILFNKRIKEDEDLEDTYFKQDYIFLSKTFPTLDIDLYLCMMCVKLHKQKEFIGFVREFVSELNNGVVDFIEKIKYNGNLFMSSCIEK